jgi:DNA-binding transcriptional regulator YiaG
MGKKKPAVPIPTMDESLTRLTRLPEDILYIREKEKLGRAQLARSLGVTPHAVYYWEKGERTPEEPLMLLSLISWADCLREREGKLRK